MLSLTIEQITEAVSALEVISGDDRMFNSVSTDSRTVKKGDLFFALHGENFDGHQFVAKAVKNGARGLVLSQLPKDLPVHITAFIVEDTLKALQSLATYNRRLSGAMVVAVTGSSGKTSTKDILYSVLSAKYRTHKTKGNLNNEVGLPLTLLLLDEEHQVAVVEMGMRGLGEINLLSKIAQPNGAVITNIGQAHMELLGSVENIAGAKGELLDHIPQQGFAVLHGDSPFIEREAKRCQGKVVMYGEKPNFQLYLKEIIAENGGNRFTVLFHGCTQEFFLPLPGQHNVINSLAAIAVGYELGMSCQEIKEGLAKASLTAMRLEVTEYKGIKIINDAYNANPDSTKAAIKVLTDTPGMRKIAVLGDMLELGDMSEEAHRKVGKAVCEAGIDLLVSVGKLGSFIGIGAQEAGFLATNIHYYNSAAEAALSFASTLKPGDVVLVKGSRGMKMEGFIEGMK